MKKYILLTLAIMHITTLNSAMVPHEPYSKNQSYAADPEHYLSQEEEENKENFFPESELIPQRETPSWNPLTIQMQNTHGIVEHKSNTTLLDGHLAIQYYGPPWEKPKWKEQTITLKNLYSEANLVPQLDYIAINSTPNIITLLSPETGASVYQINVQKYLDSKPTHFCFNFSPDGKLLAIKSCFGSTIYIIKTFANDPICISKLNEPEKIDRLDFLRSDRLMTTSSYSSAKDAHFVYSGTTLKLWNIETKQCIHEIQTPFSSFSTTVIGEQLALGRQKNNKSSAYIWTITNNDKFRYIGSTIKGMKAKLSCMAFSPDSMQLAIGSKKEKKRYSKIYIQNSDTGKLVQKLKQYDTGAIEAIAYSPDGSSLATGAEDGTMSLWDPCSGQLLNILEEGHNRRVHSLYFTPNGTHLVSTSDNGFFSLNYNDEREGTIKISKIPQIEEKKEEELQIQKEKQTSCCIS